MNPNIIFSVKKDNLWASAKKSPEKNNGLSVSGGASFSKDKESNGQILSPVIKKLIVNYQKSLIEAKKGEISVIHVDEIASKVARVYEKIRKIIDWKEENLLRRGAIVRFLKRNLLAEFSNLNFIFKIDTDNIAEPLVLELIRGGHLPNDEIPQEKILDVQKILKKYVYILKNAPYDNTGSSFKFKKKINFFDWILEIAACEIEESLSPPVLENSLMETMTELMVERIKLIPVDTLDQKSKHLQVYIAVHRTLYDLDESIITFHLFKYKYSQWTSTDDDFVKEITQNIFSLWNETEKDLKHPLSREFFNVCERADTAFTLLGDVIESLKDNPSTIDSSIENKENFLYLISNFYNKRLASLKSRLFKLAIFSTLSVFVSNWFTFFIVEVPLAHLFYQGFNWIAASVDFLLPTAVMFILVAIIQPPPASNLNKVLTLTSRFVFNTDEKDIFEIKVKKKRNPVSNAVIILFYTTTCISVFWLIARIFEIALIPFSSVVLDTIGIALNVFAALVVRNKAREISVEEKNSFWEFILDIISLPIAEIGSWLANKWREYNVVSVFFSVVIETPLIGFIGFIEQWRNFLKERKAEIH